MRGPLALRIIAACLAVPTTIAAADGARPSMALQVTTMADWRAAGLDGTGCYWSLHRGGPVHFVAAGNKAMTRIDGRIVILKPQRGARDLFPFTRDSWQSENLTIRSSIAPESERWATRPSPPTRC